MARWTHRGQGQASVQVDLSNDSSRKMPAKAKQKFAHSARISSDQQGDGRMGRPTQASRVHRQREDGSCVARIKDKWTRSLS